MRFFCLALAGCFLASPALSQTARQKDFMETVALLLAAEDRCPSWHKNSFMIASNATRLGITAEDWSEGGRLHPTMVEAYRSARAKVQTFNADLFCGEIAHSFGPSGTILPNAMILR